MSRVYVLLALLVLLAAPAAWAQGRTGLAEPGVAPDSAEETPEKLRQVGFDQNLGAPLPLDAAFVDETGRQVRLGDYFGKKPVMLSLVYYGCPMLCPMTLNGLTSSLKALTWNVGDEFEVVVVSIDPEETPEDAAEAKLQATSRYGRTGTEAGWHFLTGDEADIERLADAVGFRYQYDPERDEYGHAAGLTMITPEGYVSRYFFGTDHPAKDLRLGLVERLLLRRLVVGLDGHVAQVGAGRVGGRDVGLAGVAQDVRRQDAGGFAEIDAFEILPVAHGRHIQAEGGEGFTPRQQFVLVFCPEGDVVVGARAAAL